MLVEPVEETASTAGVSVPIIEVEDVAVRFGRVQALDGVTLGVAPGTVYGLLGPNGAGKTTLVRVLSTLLRPASGSVRVAGVDVLRHPALARSHIGLAGQYAAVDGFLTGRENVEMIGRLYNLGRREARRRAAEVLERIGLEEQADRQVKTYSGGARRRLDLAASLVGRPTVLFLDEPSTGIDPRGRAQLWEMIEQLVRVGTTILLTTQYLEEADALAARIGVIDRGRIIAEGAPIELKDALGRGVLEVTVVPEDRAEAAHALTTAAGAEPLLDPSGDTLRVAAPDGSRTLAAAVRALDAVGVEPVDIALHRPSLDDVFLALTGDDADLHRGRGAEAAEPRR